MIKRIVIEANGLFYRELNEKIRQALNEGAVEIVLEGINGQRYIAAGLKGFFRILINGTPGNDLACFMDGAIIIVNANGQDGVGNTMNNGLVVINGQAGDIVGYAMRGGKILVKGDVGYRVGIHMKSYKTQLPAIVIGGTTRDFLGEYMAGGIIIVLRLNQPASQPFIGEYIGVGMHGGTIYIRGEVEDYRLGQEVEKGLWNKEDEKIIQPYLEEFAAYFNINFKDISGEKFTKLIPRSQRPYGKIYAY